LSVFKGLYLKPAISTFSNLTKKCTNDCSSYDLSHNLEFAVVFIRELPIIARWRNKSRIYCNVIEESRIDLIWANSISVL